MWKPSELFTETARALLGGAILFALLNVPALVYVALQAPDSTTRRYGLELLREQYPKADRDEVAALLAETWSRPAAYEPFVQYTELPHRGRYVNVSPQGFRISADQGPWPPDPANVNVFLFGGSTLFGYGIRDGETIASYLQQQLDALPGARTVKCYNFGRAAYYSSQERVLFAELLAARSTPDIAVFIDGLNDFYFAEPYYTAHLRATFVPSVLRSAIDIARQLPILRALDLYRRRDDARLRGAPAIDPSFAQPEQLDQRIERYLGNKLVAERLALAFGVRPVFVIQPVPTYHYELARHPFARWSFGGHARSAYGYPRLAARIAREPQGPHLVWAADIQRGLDGPLYVDQIHYAPRLTQSIAGLIAAHLADEPAFQR